MFIAVRLGILVFGLVVAVTWAGWPFRPMRGAATPRPALFCQVSFFAY